MTDKPPETPVASAPLAEIKRLYGLLTIKEQDALRDEFFSWQPRCPRCGTPKSLNSVGCPGPGREHSAPRRLDDPAP